MNPQGYSGVLLIDGKHVPVKRLSEETLAMKAGQGANGKIPRSGKRQSGDKTKSGLVVLPFVDYWTHDIPVFVIASSENRYEIREGFRQLKEIGYDLKILVCDESMGEIAQVAKEFYPDVIIQTCLKHYKENVERALKINGIKRSMRAIENKLRKIGDSILISTRPYSVQKARKLTNRLADLEFKYGDLIRFQDAMNEILWGSDTLQQLGEAEDRMNELVAQMNLNGHPYANRIRKRYQDYYQQARGNQRFRLNILI